MKERNEYWLVLAVARTLGWLPRRLSRLLVRILTLTCYLLLARLRRVGERNLELALPELSSKARRKILRHVFQEGSHPTPSNAHSLRMFSRHEIVPPSGEDHPL